MTTTEPWGRLLIAGCTDFATAGRKDKQGKNFSSEIRPDLPAAHVVRSVANIKFKKVFTTHSGCHAVALSLDGRAFLLGRNEHHQLSHPLPDSFTTPFPLSDGNLSPTPSANEPFPLDYLPDENAPPALKQQEIVHAALGRGHTILVTKEGEAWAAGWNNLGQCGLPSSEHISSFRRVLGPLKDLKVVQASCGNAFSMFLTDQGEVYAVGTGEKGVLGNGKTGEHISHAKTFFIEQHEPLLVGGPLRGKKIVQISSGQLHTVALDDEGYCYSWGWGGLGRLGTGVQVDALIPTLVPQFSGSNPLTRCSQIAAGPACTLFIDAQGMVLLCGKWKVSGDGSSGQPWMNSKYVAEIMGYKFGIISAGGQTLFCYTKGEKKDGNFMVAWGQSAMYGELAFGAGASKSATKPQRVEVLEGIDFLDIAAGQNTTFFIARPPPLPLAEGEETSDGTSTPAPGPIAAAAAKPAGFDLSGYGFGAAAADGPTSEQEQEQEQEKPKHAPRSRTIEEAWNELQRFPAISEEVPDHCKVCGKEEGPEEALECERCENAFHAACCSPPFSGVPDGEWFCRTASVGSCADAWAPKGNAPGGNKRKAEDQGDAPAKK